MADGESAGDKFLFQELLPENVSSDNFRSFYILLLKHLQEIDALQSRMHALKDVPAAGGVALLGRAPASLRVAVESSLYERRGAMDSNTHFCCLTVLDEPSQVFLCRSRVT